MLSNSAGHGLSIPTASIDGIYVGSAGAYGTVVNHSGQDGVYVGTAGTPSSSTASTAANGFEVAGAQGSGLYVGRADIAGVYVNSAGTVGFNLNSAGSYGVYVGTAGYDGINAYGAAYAGNFVGNINVTGTCIGCLQANFAVNAGERPLQPGDVVSIHAITSTDFDTAPALWQVVQAQPGQAVVGVVAGRAELVTVAEHRPMETGKRLVPRDGAAQPGEYVTIVYSGPMQVKTAVAIAAGEKLTIDDHGHARGLRKTEVNGVRVVEDAPMIGIALSQSQDGLVWVLVNPQ